MLEKTNITNIGFTILVVLVVLTAGAAITQFFNISLAAYVPYLSWIMALAILFSVLPKNTGNIFLQN